MLELTNFPGKTRKFNIAVEIGIKYHVIGFALLNDERGTIVPAIEREHGVKAELINLDILRRWVQGEGIADRTWRGLLGVLRLHCPGLCQDIEESLANQPQSTLSDISDELRKMYAKYPLPNYSSTHCFKWMPQASKEYIHPDIISNEEQKKLPESYKKAVLRGQRLRIAEKDSGDRVQLEKLLEAKSGEKCKIVLVEGAPGIGKTILSWRVSHLWGRRELFSQYSTVLLLPLRDKTLQEAKQVEDLFFRLGDKKAHSGV